MCVGTAPVNPIWGPEGYCKQLKSHIVGLPPWHKPLPRPAEGAGDVGKTSLRKMSLRKTPLKTWLWLEQANLLPANNWEWISILTGFAGLKYSTWSNYSLEK